MIWKIVSGALAGLLIVGLFYYIPDLRFWGKKADKASTELTDSVRVLRGQLASANRIINNQSASLQQIEKDFQRTTDRGAAIIPTVTLNVKGMDRLSQEMAILKSLYQRGLDTSRSKRTESTAIALTVCDTMMVVDTIIKRAFLALQVAHYNLRDTVNAYKAKETQSIQIASQKGLLTGKNKRLRRQVAQPIQVQ